MRKEIVFAIFAGVIFGAIVAFGVWRANSALKGDGEQNTTTSTQTISEPEENESLDFGLTIAKPTQDDVVTEPSIAISGITSPNSLVVISSEEEDFIIQSEEKSSFEQNIELIGGINRITITAFDNSGNSTKETVRIIYSSEFADLVSEQKKES